MLLSVEETCLKGIHSELHAGIKHTGVVQIRQRNVHAGHPRMLRHDVSICVNEAKEVWRATVAGTWLTFLNSERLSVLNV